MKQDNYEKYDEGKDYFGQYLEALQKLYEYDPVEAVEYAGNSLDRLRHRKMRQKIKLDDKQIDVLLMCVFGLLIALSGLLYLGEGTFFAGLIFFMAGILIGINVPGFGIIFLFAHGAIGFAFMSADVYELVKNHPFLTDPSPALKVYISMIVLSIGLAVLLSILQGFIKKIREIKHIKPFIMFLYFLGVLLIRLLPYKLGIAKLFDFIR